MTFGESCRSRDALERPAVHFAQQPKLLADLPLSIVGRPVAFVRDRARAHPLDAAVDRRRRRAEHVEALGRLRLERSKCMREIRAEVHAVAAPELFAPFAVRRLDAEFDRAAQGEREFLFVVVAELQLVLGDRHDPSQHRLEMPADKKVGQGRIVMR